ncbi:hypothetical protein BGW38_004646 [Lunasporangiospora selenospora]|uniref:Uncharacterized protein n=1 Tax=Lunasporangiospora selenospora TaxID=979761 RepID=A0A9P6FZZ0_9FUNG|nr:hypothetical protein BGW38_004646 [Lunasporangiospora selenospora]
MSDVKQEINEESAPENTLDLNEKGDSSVDSSIEVDEKENSPIEAVRLAVPVTDDPSLPVVTFRFWIISLIFTALGATIQQYYFFRSTYGAFSIFFVNLASFSMGNAMARWLPTKKWTIFGQVLSLNPGPFNIKEHALIGVAVATGANSAYAVDILSATDLYLGFRINALGSLLLIMTTQCLGYGMAGMLRKFLVYPSEMVWYSNLVQVAFFNTIHNTEEYKQIRLVRGWSRMKFFWIVAAICFVYQFIPQWLAPLLVYFDWICWINPFNMNVWALFSSMSGAGILSLSFDWTSIAGQTLYLPLNGQLCWYGGIILSYWIIMPIMWITNTLDTKTLKRPLSARLFHEDGTMFNINKFLTKEHTLNSTLYDASPPVRIAPMYAIGFMTSFIALSACFSHVACFHGAEIWASWKRTVKSKDEDIHTRMMRVYPEVPQSWYAIFYIIMVALSIVACELYGTQLPWWGLLLSLFVGWALTLPLGVIQSVTGYSPRIMGLTELICGYALPGKPIANMTFKCYSFFNYMTMILIIDSQRPALNGEAPDRHGLWTGQRALSFWGSALVYGALGPQRMFALDGRYWFVFLGFAIGIIAPIILWLLSKAYPRIQWSKFNIAVIAGGMGIFPNGYTVGVFSSLVVSLIFQYYIFRYHKTWWTKYVYILSAALDTGAAFTGLIIFLFIGGGLSGSLNAKVPSWWANHYVEDNRSYPNYPYLGVDRCGAADDKWTGGTL